MGKKPHKRPGRKAKIARQERAKNRQLDKAVEADLKKSDLFGNFSKES